MVARQRKHTFPHYPPSASLLLCVSALKTNITGEAGEGLREAAGSNIPRQMKGGFKSLSARRSGNGAHLPTVGVPPFHSTFFSRLLAEVWVAEAAESASDSDCRRLPA